MSVDKAIPPPERKECLIAIGRIVANMSGLEHWMTLCFSFALGVDYSLTMSIIAQEKFDTILKMLNGIVVHKIKDPKLQEQFKEIYNKIDSLNTQRNHYIHSFWFFAGDSFGQAMKYSKNKADGVSVSIEHIEIKDLNQLADDAVTVAGELSQFIMKHFPPQQTKR